jgi:hypothetical protein
MNDELSAQLSSRYSLPLYARDQLYVQTPEGVVKAEGEHGLFTLPAPALRVIVRWGGADGAILAALNWQADNLEWDGVVRLAGYFDAVHLSEIGSAAVALLWMGAQPLKPASAAYPAASTRKFPIAFPDAFTQTVDDVQENIVTWVADAESPVYGLAHDALVSKLRVFAFGRLADDKSAWHKRFALPLLLESITLFAP